MRAKIMLLKRRFCDLISWEYSVVKKIRLFILHRKWFCVFWVLFVSLSLAAGFRYYRYYQWAKENPVSVYDLTWVDRTDSENVVYRRWRYYIESKTYLPRKIKKYSKVDPGDSYVLEETVTVGYPTNEDVMQVIKDIGSGDLEEEN